MPSKTDQDPLELKKKAGTLILSINSDILELQQAYCRVKEGGQLSNADADKEKKVSEKKVKLEEIVQKLRKAEKGVKSSAQSEIVTDPHWRTFRH